MVQPGSLLQKWVVCKLQSIAFSTIHTDAETRSKRRDKNFLRLGELHEHNPIHSYISLYSLVVVDSMFKGKEKLESHRDGHGFSSTMQAHWCGPSIAEAIVLC